MTGCMEKLGNLGRKTPLPRLPSLPGGLLPDPQEQCRGSGQERSDASWSPPTDEEGRRLHVSRAQMHLYGERKKEPLQAGQGPAEVEEATEVTPLEFEYTRPTRLYKHFLRPWKRNCIHRGSKISLFALTRNRSYLTCPLAPFLLGFRTRCGYPAVDLRAHFP